MRFSKKNVAPPGHRVASAHARAARKIRFVPSTGTAASSHASANSPGAPASARTVSPHRSGVTTDTRS